MNSLADSMQCHGDSIRCYGAWHLMPGGKTSDPDFVRRDVANTRPNAGRSGHRHSSVHPPAGYAADRARGTNRTA